MALVMGMMVCVRSWGGRCRRRPQRNRKGGDRHGGAYVIRFGRDRTWATCKDGCTLMGPVSCSWSISCDCAVWCDL
jgi:hypothetical protein